MTKIEALKMVRNAEHHAQSLNAKPRVAAKVDREVEKTFFHLINGLEFEAFFEAGGTVRRVA